MAGITTTAVTPGLAQVYGCTGQTSPTWQATPCLDGGDLVRVPVHQPDAAERAAAREVARRERKFVDLVEAERERARKRAEAARQRQELEQQTHTTRCGNYLKKAERAEEAANTHKRPTRYKREQERRAKELRDRHFSECFTDR